MTLGSTDAEYEKVFKIRRGTLVEDIVHGCSYFKIIQIYWKPVKLFESRSDVRPTMPETFSCLFSVAKRERLWKLCCQTQRCLGESGVEIETQFMYFQPIKFFVER